MIIKPSLPSEPEQHDAHRKTWIDFWCAQLDRKIRHYDAVDEKRKQSDNDWDRENGDLNA